MPQVKRDFEQVYAAEQDPWGIGDADSERYELYRRLILGRDGPRRSLLDVGCGFGAFLARFEGDFEQLVGVELSAIAVEKGRRRFPAIDFVQGSATALNALPAIQRRFDAVVLSDVLYYLDEPARTRALRWISAHLSDGGFALVAGYCPGGDYLTLSEMRAVVERDLVVDCERSLESRHAVMLCERKRRRVALTVDYETWQPIPEGRTIDWERDIFAPTRRLLDACDRERAKVTLMAEMGEYAWLRKNDPPVAARMEAQWRNAVLRGHDVQLHLHPAWLPELGAHRTADGGWRWDWTHPTAADYPGDLGQLFGRLKGMLEETVQPIAPGYSVTCFRAGAYEAQPFSRIYDALAANGIGCDSSVYRGGRHPDRYYDYRFAYSRHQPWFAGRYDPQLKAPPAEREVVEIPVFTYGRSSLWTFDNEEGARFAGRLIEYAGECPERGGAVARRRRADRVLGSLGWAYWSAKRWRRVVNLALPRPVAHRLSPYQPERLVDHEYYVLVGHTKADLDIEAIAAGIRALREDGRFDLVTLGEMAVAARAELASSGTRDHAAEAKRQVAREYDAVLGSERNEAPSFQLQDMIPLDRRRVLDLGCGAGAWTDRIARLHPWMEAVGIDVGADFIERARCRYGSARVSFRVEDFAELSFDGGSFDCIYADNTLEHAFDVDRTLAEVHRVLSDAGVLVAAIPSDARNPERTTDNHTWKTAPHDVRARLQAAGFHDISIREVDTFRSLGQPPYPPANDRMMYVRARKHPVRPWERVDALVRWAYESLDPSRPQISDDPAAIVADGSAWCWGYVLVLGDTLRREGCGVRWVTMAAERHPHGRGPTAEDTHEVLEVTVRDGSRGVVDPMAGVRFSHSLDELLARPALADIDRSRDGRYRQREYDLYATSFWYERVVRVAVRSRPSDPLAWTSAADVGRLSPSRALARRARAAAGRLRRSLRS